MIMSSGLRRLALTTHVTTSVGWLGAVAAFLALAVVGLTGDGVERVRGSYLAMDTVAWLVIVPLSGLSLVSGLVQSLGTTWGLFRHYWVVAKLLIAVLATAALLVHMRPISYLADVAAQAAGTALFSADLRGMRLQLMVNAVAAVVALLAATVLSVYKPRGLTRYGQRVSARAARGTP